ncbi:MAG: heme NO-binding domain-containing protein [Pseudomonadota bacterium]
MYGLVNKGIRDFAIKEGGDLLWQKIRTRAGCKDDDFLSMHAYEDVVTVNLVDAAAAVLNLPAAEVMRLFGHHWVLYTADAGYGPLMKLSGDTLLTFLQNLDSMHARIQSSMPELRPPRFSCTVLDETTYQVDYISERAGLYPMVQGLLEGVAARLNEPAKVFCDRVSDDEHRAVFRVCVQ